MSRGAELPRRDRLAQQPGELRDRVLDEWRAVQPADFATFGPRVGMSQAAFEQLFTAAAQDGDPRAVRPAGSIPRRGRLMLPGGRRG